MNSVKIWFVIQALAQKLFGLGALSAFGALIGWLAGIGWLLVIAEWAAGLSFGAWFGLVILGTTIRGRHRKESKS